MNRPAAEMQNANDTINPLEPVEGPFQPGQPLWVVVNGEPALRYYVRPHNRGHVLTFNHDDLERGVYYDYPVFYRSEAAILLRMMDGLEQGIVSKTRELARRRTQLAACMRTEPVTIQEPPREGEADAGADHE